MQGTVLMLLGLAGAVCVIALIFIVILTRYVFKQETGNDKMQAIALAIKEGAIENGMNIENIFEFLTAKEAGKFIKTFLQKRDTILVKGSQGMRMERVTEVILLDQKNKDKLLVRQDTEWLKKK